MNPALFSSLTDALPEPTFLLGTDGSIIAANLVAIRTLGRSRDSLFGTSMNEYIANDPAQFRAYLASASASRQLLPGKIEIQKLDGTTTEFRTDAAVVLGPDSVSTTGVLLRLRTAEMGMGGFGALNKKITELTGEIKARRKIESDLLEAKQAAEAANKAKSEFLANMSHEIRTPMTAILGYSDLLIDPTFSVNARQEAILAINRNGHHLLAIIDDLLDIAKIEADKLDIKLDPVSPNELIADVVSLMRVKAISKGLSISVSYGFPFPSVIYTDATRLRQILLNVIGNAIKFTDTGSVRITARVDLSDATKQLLIVDIADTGSGIDAEQQKTIFKPFVQADTSMTRKFGGTGLGLAICKRLAEMLGGDIALKSLTNRGSTFSISVNIGNVDTHSFLNEMSEITVAHTAPMAPEHSSTAPPDITAGRLQATASPLQTQPPQLTNPQNTPPQTPPPPTPPTPPPTPGQQQPQTVPPTSPAPNSTTPPFYGPYPQMNTTPNQGSITPDQIPPQNQYTQYQTLAPTPNQTTQLQSPHTQTPATPPTPPAYDAPPVPQPQPEAQQPNGKLRGRILLAEDGPDNQRILMLHLAEAGLHVEVVEDGVAAIQAISQAIEIGNPYDILLLDMQMPLMDGYTAARTLREQGIPIPIIAVTAHAMTGDREKCLGAGCDDYIAKPFTRANLIAIVSEHLLRAQADGIPHAA